MFPWGDWKHYHCSVFFYIIPLEDMHSFSVGVGISSVSCQ